MEGTATAIIEEKDGAIKDTKTTMATTIMVIMKTTITTMMQIIQMILLPTLTPPLQTTLNPSLNQSSVKDAAHGSG